MVKAEHQRGLASMDDEGRLDRRRGVHGSLSARLAGLSDQQLIGLLGTGTSWHAHIHGNQSGVVEIEGAKVFVKKITLTDLERENEGATTNLFGLPGFYQYGVGSAGFGAWRELAAYRKASAWALSGEHSSFPLVYHWRVLPRPERPQLTERQLDWLQKAPAYWNGSDAVRVRLEAIAAASATIVLFLEYVPQTLHAWLGESLAGPSLDAAEDGILRLYEQVQDTATFMNARGMLHFDLHAFNVLTDGERAYVADLGLALCADFDLSPSERAFFEAHRLYDRGCVAWNFLEQLRSKDGSALMPALDALVERWTPAARVVGAFIEKLGEESKTTPYPAAELEAALADN